MNKLFTDEAWDDYTFWFNTDKKILKKINDLIKEIERTPFTGKGKPEPLKYSLSGYWSRRINHEHRIVYQVDNDQLVFISFRYHYKKWYEEAAFKDGAFFGVLFVFFTKNMKVGSLHHLNSGLAAEVENIGFNRFGWLLSAGVLTESFHFIKIFYGSFVD